MPSTFPTIAVCGLGRLGSHLARALIAADLPLSVVVSSDQDHARTITRSSPAITIRSDIKQALVEAELIFLCLPDRVLSDLSGELARHSKSLSLKEKTIIHCSGALLANELSSLEGVGAKIGVFHPLQAFPPKQSQASPFKDIAIGVEGSERELLTRIANALGSIPFELPKDADERKRYHLAAVLASNALVTLADAAASVMRTSGVTSDPQALLLPLIKGTLENLNHAPAEEALTGPVARGDLKTLQAHLDQLKDSPELRTTYVHTMQAAAQLAFDAKRIDKETFAAIKALLDK